MSSESYAVLLDGRLPHKLFEDMESAKEYVEEHERLDFSTASVFWPVSVEDGDSA